MPRVLCGMLGPPAYCGIGRGRRMLLERGPLGIMREPDAEAPELDAAGMAIPARALADPDL